MSKTRKDEVYRFWMRRGVSHPRAMEIAEATVSGVKEEPVEATEAPEVTEPEPKVKKTKPKTVRRLKGGRK